MKGGILVGAAHRELVHVRLADEDGVGGVEIGNDGRVVGWTEVLKNLRRTGRQLPLCTEEILDSDRQSCQFAQGFALLPLRVDFLGLLQGGFRTEPDEGTNGRIQPVDSIQIRLRQFDGGEIARLKTFELFRRG